MRRNVGNIDRIIRTVLGLTIIGVGVYYQSYWGAVGVVALSTAVIGWCPAYLPFGISSCKLSSEKKYDG